MENNINSNNYCTICYSDHDTLKCPNKCTICNGFHITEKHRCLICNVLNPNHNTIYCPIKLKIYPFKFI